MGYLLPTTTWTLAAQCSLRYWHCSGLLTIYWQVYISAWSRACMQGALPEQDTIVNTAANADLLTKTCLVVCWCKQGLKCRRRLPGLFGDVSPHFFFRGLHRLPKIFNPKPPQSLNLRQSWLDTKLCANYGHLMQTMNQDLRLYWVVLF